MNIHYKQPQFELFPANSAVLEDVNKPRFFLANLTLSIEGLVILTILGIMVALCSFSLGVERGKYLTAQVLDERVAAAWNVSLRKTAVIGASVLSGEVKPALSLPVSVHSAGGRQAGAGPMLRVASRRSVAITPGVAKPVHSVSIQPIPMRFTWQAATYQNEGYAQKDALDLRAKGLQSFLIKSGKYWLLCVGNFTNKENAAAFSRKLPASYRNGKVRRF